MTTPGRVQARSTGEIKVCPVDGEPVIFTFKYPGHEYVCLVCGWLGGVLGTPHAAATPERVRRHAELKAQYDEANGVRPEPPLPETPICQGCGAEAPTPHKPPHWFAAGRGDKTRYACSRECIPSREMVLPW